MTRAVLPAAISPRVWRARLRIGEREERQAGGDNTFSGVVLGEMSVEAGHVDPRCVYMIRLTIDRLRADSFGNTAASLDSNSRAGVAAAADLDVLAPTTTGEATTGEAGTGDASPAAVVAASAVLVATAAVFAF